MVTCPGKGNDSFKIDICFGQFSLVVFHIHYILICLELGWDLVGLFILIGFVYKSVLKETFHSRTNDRVFMIKARTNSRGLAEWTECVLYCLASSDETLI